MEIILDKDERLLILKQRLEKTEAEMTKQYNYAEAAAICADTKTEVQCRNMYYALYDEAQKIKKAIEDESK